MRILENLPSVLKLPIDVTKWLPSTAFVQNGASQLIGTKYSTKTANFGLLVNNRGQI